MLKTFRATIIQIRMSVKLSLFLSAAGENDHICENCQRNKSAPVNALGQTRTRALLENHISDHAKSVRRTAILGVR